MSIGHKIKKIRNEKKVSQQKMAEHLNISRQAISRWENDVSLPDITTLISIAKFFEVPFNYFSDDKIIESEKEDNGDTEQVVKPKDNVKPSHDEIITRSTRYIVVVASILTLVAILPSKVKVPIIFYGIIFIIFFMTCLLIYYIIKNYLIEIK
ncbi:helix-turn-helix domain-containing protein [Vagococcus fluvialis]|uniref:Transcriptional regulator, XRE family n=1 Tax=Vagococcus fluvialis bH819 TaxID=1255619 RepID=A0A1X6WRJ6_9ENTE|nr:helix-turn-helix transcriptional regulator [Vagococcus fluvialis]SLM86963.1 Transcriptional regulator, XRE family [Vagococcus fluvialis bH819]